jgi:hypothetical protein
MPRALSAAWKQVAPAHADAFRVTAFDAGNRACERVLLQSADVVSVYGSDETIAEIRARGDSDKPFIAHGHGIGAAFVDADGLGRQQLIDVVDRLATDVAAYDQRGCLSPHLVFIQTDDPAPFAEELSAALERIARRLPLGSVPMEARARLAQWRGVAQATGRLIRTNTSSIALRDPSAGHPLRPTPGYRHVDMRACESLTHAVTQLSALGPHLKCLGVREQMQDAARRELARLDATLPRICDLGRMQRPVFDAWAEGHPPWRGLVRRR